MRCHGELLLANDDAASAPAAQTKRWVRLMPMILRQARLGVMFLIGPMSYRRWRERSDARFAAQFSLRHLMNPPARRLAQIRDDR